jgi:hypothetical protein
MHPEDLAGPRWRLSASCRGLPVDHFVKAIPKADYTEARRLCAVCPVRRQCLQTRWRMLPGCSGRSEGQLPSARSCQPWSPAGRHDLSLACERHGLRTIVCRSGVPGVGVVISASNSSKDSGLSGSGVRCRAFIRGLVREGC